MSRSLSAGVFYDHPEIRAEIQVMKTEVMKVPGSYWLHQVIRGKEG
jgi:hypothetical protein